MLELMPISLAVANGFVAEHHRHHKPVRGHKFSLGCMVDGRLVGVAIVGRPVSRYLDDGLTLEVNRLCTDGTKNACSFLYGAAARAAPPPPIRLPTSKYPMKPFRNRLPHLWECLAWEPSSSGVPGTGERYTFQSGRRRPEKRLFSFFRSEKARFGMA